MPSSVCPCTLLELHVGSPGQQPTGAISAHVMALTHKPSFGRSVSQKCILAHPGDFRLWKCLFKLRRSNLGPGYADPARRACLLNWAATTCVYSVSEPSKQGWRLYVGNSSPLEQDPRFSQQAPAYPS